MNWHLIPEPLRRLITIFTGVYSFSAVYLFCGMIVLLPVGLVAARSDSAIATYSFRNDETTLALGLSCLLAIYASFPIARFITRLLTVPANGTLRYGRIVTTCLTLVIPIAITLPTSPDLFLLTIPWSVTNAAAAIWIVTWQVQGRRLRDKPFILYLRRFSTFADRSVLKALLKTHPRDHRMAFLAPVEDSPANLSPALVALTGIRWLQPVNGAPLALSARNVEWEDRIEDLLHAAACIVIDTSYSSPGLEREKEMVLALKAPSKVLWLADAKAASAHVPRAVDSTQIVRYDLSWKVAAPRIFFEALLLTAASVFLSGTFGSTSASWFAGACFLLLGLPFILQPSMRRSDRARIRSSLLMKLREENRPAPKRSNAPNSEQPICAVLVPQSGRSSRIVQILEQAAERAGLRCERAGALDAAPRAFRDCLRLIDGAAIVAADLSTPDAEIDYLLGIAQGLGKKVLLVTNDHANRQRGSEAILLAPQDETAVQDLTQAYQQLLRDTGSRPWSGLLSDQLVFGEAFPCRRMFAFSIDLALSTGLAWLFQSWRGLPIDGGLSWVVGDFAVSIVFFFIGYRSLLLALSATTLGMYVAGLRVVSTERDPIRPLTALGRSAAFMLNLIPFCAYFYALYSPRYQALEDVLSGTQVVRRRRE